MGQLRSCTLVFALLVIGALLTGCARRSYLHWQGGDVFGVFEAGGRPPSRIDCPGTIEERFDCFAAKLRARVGEASAGLAVIGEDGALLENTMTEPGQAAPTTSETLFPLLSITKMFTAATAVSLAQEGLLDLKRPIASYLPELAGRELGRATLHQLMTHTAGLVDDPHHALCQHGNALSAATTRAHLGAQPGAVYLYSNIGYALVGLVVERTTSRSFEDVVRARVLSPMEMSTATFEFSKIRLRGHPEGAGADSRCRLAAPAGGLNASSRDLARWARAMSEPATHPLGQALVETLMTPYVETGARPDEAYGYGVFRMRFGDQWVFHHPGEVRDFSAFVGWVPARRLGVAAMTNLGRGTMIETVGGTLGVVGLRELSVLSDLPADFGPQLGGSPRPSSAYVGTYVDRKSWLGRLRVRLDDEGRLAFDYLDGPPALLPPTFVFRFVPGEARARFVVTVVGVGERVADERSR